MGTTVPSSFVARHAATACVSRYERNAEWLGHYDRVAARIIEDIGPRTVLDAGCGLGMLVEVLRQRGVEAYGIDIAEPAIAGVAAEARPYCWRASVADPLPQAYDLIVTLDVMEHLARPEAGAAIANLCGHTDDVLFSSTPFDYEEATHYNVQPPEYWAEEFARHGFYRDVDFDASFLTPWAIRFRRSREPFFRVLRQYDRQYWMLSSENETLRNLAIETRDELATAFRELAALREELAHTRDELQALARAKEAANAAQERTIQSLTGQLRAWETRQYQLEQTMGWRVLRTLQSTRGRLAPPQSLRDQAIERLLRAMRGGGWTAPAPASANAPTFGPERAFPVEPVTPRPPLVPHQAGAEVVVCVHNALPDVQACLASVLEHTTPPYALILVDDGSAAETRDFLAQFAAEHRVVLLRNEEARGYTCAANQGLRQSSADYVVLLNSDTIVTPGWLDRMIACAESDPRIGLVGPLSNTASWQSIPELEHEGDWAANWLPEGLTPARMGEMVARDSGRLYPSMPLLNGFCLLLRRATINALGYFDEETFGAGYGEEDDYTLRARQAGWLLALADDTYIYHAQSRSYSTEKRYALTEGAGQRLRQKHGQEIIDQSVQSCLGSRVLAGVRARSRVIPERLDFVRRGRERFGGRRVLFILPIAEPGGGGNVIISEALAMQEMGVEVQVFNLEAYRPRFERAYPNFPLPITYGTEEQVPEVAAGYDAAIATFNTSVAWLAPLSDRAGGPVCGYYIQGFEPYIYNKGTEDHQRALDSYTLLPDLIRFTKTGWTRQEVLRATGADSYVIGVSVDTDLFRPRPRLEPAGPGQPLRLAAMVRPASPYREPELTLSVLSEAARTFGKAVEVVLFGAALDDPWFRGLAHDFAWRQAGVLNRRQTANLLNQVDVFADFSSHQAMGLTALEAMCCGAAVIVPARGGAVEFARDGQNSLVVDTGSRQACWGALRRLIEDQALRTGLQNQALSDVCAYFPERPAYNILQALFTAQDRRVP